MYPKARKFLQLNTNLPNPLTGWMEAHNIDIIDLAQRCGIHPQTLERFRTGMVIPTLVHAMALEKATGGQLRVMDWAKHPMVEADLEWLEDRTKTSIETWLYARGAKCKAEKFRRTMLYLRRPNVRAVMERIHRQYLDMQGVDIAEAQERERLRLEAEAQEKNRQLIKEQVELKRKTELEYKLRQLRVAGKIL